MNFQWTPIGGIRPVDVPCSRLITGEVLYRRIEHFPPEHHCFLNSNLIGKVIPFDAGDGYGVRWKAVYIDRTKHPNEVGVSAIISVAKSFVEDAYAKNRPFG